MPPRDAPSAPPRPTPGPDGPDLSGTLPDLRTWRLDAGTAQTLVLAAAPGRLPRCIHWGAPLPAGIDLAALARAAAPDVTGGMLDRDPDLSLCPLAADSFPGHPGLILADATGAPFLPRFAFRETEEDGDLALICADDALGLTLTFRFDADPGTGIVTARTILDATAPIRVHWLAAPVLPAPQHATEMIDVTGRWCGEFQLNRIPWTPGQHARNNRTGRTDHAHFPGLLIPAHGTANTHGDAWGLHYGWSGGHGMVAEELADGRRQIQFGHAPGSDARPATRFETAPLHLAYGRDGLNAVATAFQRHVRDRIVSWPKPGAARAAPPRPVHYNCWEAVYFDHDPATLKDIATRAAALGAERFVLDDGWFGGKARGRDDGTTSLGDWRVDPRKWPDGLTPLIDHVHAQGMTFGLWVEPEMTNLDSDLARAHPDWILGPPNQIEGRHQRVLDLANPAVADHIHTALAAILRDNAVDYLKWDHNRVLPAPDAAQTRGLYALLDRLRADVPGLEIESCASGGGRIDYGILARTCRVWLSDSNDALERLRIQADAALFLPAAVTGSHVGPRRSHTSGRILDISFRAWVATQRHMGFEMDPRELDSRETRVLTDVTAWWKANRDWTMRADILRLDSADPAILAEQQMAEDGTRFVVFAGRAATSAQIAPRPLRLTRLDPDATYRVALLNRAEASPRLSRGPAALRDGPLDLPGAWLMAQGLTLPWSCPETMWVVEGHRL